MRALAAGERFGKLTIIEEAWRTRRGPYVEVWYRVQCDCGQTNAVRGSRLTEGTTKSCGCGAPGGRAAVEKRMATSLAKTLKQAAPYELSPSEDAAEVAAA